MKYWRLIGITLGISLLGYLLYRVGFSQLWQSLRLLGWGYALVLAAGFAWELVNTVGFLESFAGKLRISFGRLFEIRLVGETFNALLPSGYIGGEPLKVKFLCADLPVHEASAGVLVAKVAQSLSLVLYLVVGLTIFKPDRPSILNDRKVFLSIGLLAVGIVIFAILIARGSFSQVSGLLHRWTNHSWFKRQEHHLKALDRSLQKFFREEKTQFVKSLLWHTAGWFVSATEVWLILFLLRTSVSWKSACFMAAMAQLGSSVAVAVPEGVGFYEGGHYLAATLLGLPPTLGLSVGLIRRVREIFWHGVGLLMFWHLSNELTKTQTLTESTRAPEATPTKG